MKTNRVAKTRHEDTKTPRHEGARGPLLGMVLAGLAWVAAAWPPSVAAAQEDASAAESLRDWQFFIEFDTAAAGDGSPWYDFVLVPSVFDQARLDLGDLRLYDAAGREVPYALRVRRAQSESRPITAREFNRTAAADGSRELSLDLGESPPEHNQIELATAGSNFRRRVRLEGSDDGTNWRVLVEQAFLLHFQRADQKLIVERVEYPASRFRYLRVRLYADAEVDRQPVELPEAKVYYAVEVPGEPLLLPAQVGPREAVQGDGGPGSAWTFDLGYDNVPCDRLLVHATDAEFVRTYRVEAAGPPGSDRPFRFVSRDEWRRRAGESAKPLEARFGELTANRLKLVVTDHRNPPLTIAKAEFSAAARQIVFARSETLRPPLRLYFGNPKALPPNYDFARQLTDRLDPAPARLRLGERQTNPDYRPPPKPLTERWPWLIYVVLSTAALVLAGLLVHLARSAICEYDASKQTAGPAAT